MLPVERPKNALKIDRGADRRCRNRRALPHRKLCREDRHVCRTGSCIVVPRNIGGRYRAVPLIVQIGLIEVRQQLGADPGNVVVDRRAVDDSDVGIGKLIIQVVVVMQCQPKLFQVVFALCSPGCFAGLLHGGKQQCNQNSDDGNYHQQFNQRESSLPNPTSLVNHLKSPKNYNIKTENPTAPRCGGRSRPS